MREKSDLNFIRNMLTYWVTAVKMANTVADTDINRTSENLVCRLLNEAFEYNLINLNRERLYHRAVDLGDRHVGIAFQVTSKTTLDKIKDTLKKFYAPDGPCKEFPDGISFFFLNETPPNLRTKTKEALQQKYPGFRLDKHIWSMKNLQIRLEKLYSEDQVRFNRAKEILEAEFGKDGKFNHRRNLMKIREKILKGFRHEGPFVKPRFTMKSEQPSFGRYRSENQDIFHILRESDRVIVLGNIGYGKTTLCNRYSADKKTKEMFWLPLVVQLRFYKGEEGIYSLICRTIERLGKPIDSDGLDYLLNAEKTVSFIFDGFNEIPPKDKDFFLREINAFGAKTSHHQIIVTCQHECYNNEFDKFTEVCLQPWTESQIKEYLKQTGYTVEEIDDFLAKSRLHNECKGLLSHPFFAEYLVKEYKEKGAFPANRKMLLDCIFQIRLRGFGIDEKAIRLAEAVKFNLTEMAFALQNDYSMSICIEQAQKHIEHYYSSRGGQEACGYTSSDLWESILRSSFIKNHKFNLTFIHEIWQDYFASLKLERALDMGNDNIWELAADTWWYNAFLFLFTHIPQDKIRELLENTLEKNEYALLGYALRREAGSNANSVAREIINTLTGSEKYGDRSIAYKAMGLAPDTPWCIEKLCDCIDREHKPYIDQGGESLIGNVPLFSIPGFEAYSSLVRFNNGFGSKLSIDSLETILTIDINTRTLYVRVAATRLLRGAITIIPDEELFTILEKRIVDKEHQVRNAVVDVVERFWWECDREILRNSSLYPRIISILKSVNDQNALYILDDMGEIDKSGRVTKEYLSLIDEAEKALQDKDPKIGYYLVSNQSDPVAWEPYTRAYACMSVEAKRNLLRLTIDHISKNRTRIENANNQLSLILEPEARLQYMSKFPELHWSDFESVLEMFGAIANKEDISRFRGLIINPPDIWDNSSNKARLAWKAAVLLVTNYPKQNLTILKELIKLRNLTTIIASLALIYGEQLGKWKTNSFDFINCRNYSKEMENHDFLSTFLQLENGYDLIIRYEIIDSFFTKFGVERIRMMVNETYETKPEIALEFAGCFGQFREPDDLKERLSNASKSAYHESIKSLLRTPDKNQRISLYHQPKG